jgi:hypothetical protein
MRSILLCYGKNRLNNEMSDLNSLPLSALKKMAKGRKIKQYYILPKARLIELLGMPELPSRYRIEKMTIIELREVAKTRELRGFWGLNKEQLTRMLFPEEDNTILCKMFRRWLTIESGSVMFGKNDPHHDRYHGFELYKAIVRFCKDTAVPRREIALLKHKYGVESGGDNVLLID